MADVYAKNVSTTAEEAEKIVPRAEFRVFGHDIIPLVREKMWSAHAVLFKARKMPQETYFLSRHTTDANVKVRDGLLDIKTRVGNTPDGYEIFQPRGKFQFPVPRAELETILSHLKIEMSLNQDKYTIEEFIAMVKRNPDMAAVFVEKMRYGFTVNDIICEYAQVWFNGGLMESACCESEDYAGMKGAIEALGIANMPNTNYLKAARRIVGME